MKYPITEIFWTIQGEGALLGVPMRFIRLAGCSIGCPQCDTDYGVRERMTAEEIGERVRQLPYADYIWITGGEPADHNLEPLSAVLRTIEMPSNPVCYSNILIATSGLKQLQMDWTQRHRLSVSPHGKPCGLVYSSAWQINLVPGLNGLSLSDWESFDAGFANRYVTPMDQSHVAECVDFIQRHPGWRLGVQAHKVWGLR